MQKSAASERPQRNATKKTYTEKAPPRASSSHKATVPRIVITDTAPASPATTSTPRNASSIADQGAHARASDSLLMPPPATKGKGKAVQADGVTDDFSEITGIIHETPTAWRVQWTPTNITKPGPKDRASEQVTETALAYWNNEKSVGRVVQNEGGEWEPVEQFLEPDADDILTTLECIFEMGHQNKDWNLAHIPDGTYAWPANSSRRVGVTPRRVINPKHVIYEALRVLLRGGPKHNEHLIYTPAENEAYQTTTFGLVKALQNHPFKYEHTALEAASFYLNEAMDQDYLDLFAKCRALLKYAPHLHVASSATNVLAVLVLTKEDIREVQGEGVTDEKVQLWKSLAVRWFCQQLREMEADEEIIRGVRSTMIALAAVLQRSVGRARRAAGRE